VKISGDVVRFDYVAKSGKRRIQSIVDPAVVAVVNGLKRRRGGGPELLAYQADGKTWSDVKSHDINAYIKDVTGGDFTAKDFRTWSATVLASVALAVSREATTATARKRAVARAMQETSHYLGNTPVVCRASYVDPRVIDRYYAGETIHDSLSALGDGTGPGALSTQGEVEDAVLQMLDAAPEPALQIAG
jgi:DNA topoisomerase IB